LIKNKINGKCYVGQTRRSMEQRLYSHKKVVGKANACKALSDAMLKHGVDNFEIRLLHECGCQAEMDSLEIKAIAELGTFAPGGYNLTIGGGGKSGYKHSAESIEKMASTHRGKPLTEDHKQKVSASLKGNKRALGYRHTEETKRLLGDRTRGTTRPPFSDSHRQKIAAARAGTKASIATRLKMSASHTARHEAARAEAILIGHHLLRAVA
jgi:group I intron endonuclease